MLDELSETLPSFKLKDLATRLNDKRVEQVLPAEMELGLVWAIRQLGELEVEPSWWPGAYRPDVYSKSLLFDRYTAVEIAAASDNAIGGENEMDRICLQMVNYANGISRGMGNFLYFTFAEKSGYVDGKYRRERMAPARYNLSDHTKELINLWLSDSSKVVTPLDIVDSGVHVVVTRKEHKQFRYHNFHCSMPPEAYSLRENPLANLLRDKKDQVKEAPQGVLRCLFLADVGSTLLRNVGLAGEKDLSGRRISGSSVIIDFMQEYQHAIDAVVVFSPYRDHSNFHDRHIRWRCFTFTQKADPDFVHSVQRIAEFLPKPRFEGRQARSLHRDGRFSPVASGWYSASFVRSTMGKSLEISVSARALLDLLSGRITLDYFRHATGLESGVSNVFLNALRTGQTFSAVKLESGGLDEEDDQIVFQLENDPAVQKFRASSEATESGTGENLKVPD